MIRIEFSSSEIERLEKERWQHPDPRVQRRLHALYYKAMGYPHQEIAKLVGVSAKSLRTFLRLYQEVGINALKTFNYPKPISALAAKSMKEAAHRIQEKIGVKRSRFQVSRYLNTFNQLPYVEGFRNSIQDWEL